MPYEHDPNEHLHYLLYHVFMSSVLNNDTIPRLRSPNADRHAVQKINSLHTHLPQNLKDIGKHTPLVGDTLTIITEITDSVLSFTIQSNTSTPRWTLIVSSAIDKTRFSPEAPESLNDPDDTTFFAAITSLDCLTATGPASFEKSLKDFFATYPNRRYQIDLITLSREPCALFSISSSRKTVKLGLQLWRLKKSTDKPLFQECD